MKKKIIQIALIGGIVLILAGCVHYYYAPNASNIPLFKEKNTMKINGGYSSGDNYNGGDVQFAYSVSSKIGILFNSFFAGLTEDVANEGNSSTYHKESGKGSLFEIGAGYYKPFGTQNRWVFETYAGVGAGAENHTYESNQRAKINLSRFFIQPSIGYSSRSGRFEAAAGSRFCDLHLKVKHHNITGSSNSSDEQDLYNIGLHPSSVLWEPSLLVAAGWPNFKFYTQLTQSLNLNNAYYLAQDKTNFSLGVRFIIK